MVSKHFNSKQPTFFGFFTFLIACFFFPNVLLGQVFRLEIEGGSHAAETVVDFSIKAGTASHPLVVGSSGILDTVYYDPLVYAMDHIDAEYDCSLSDGELSVTSLPAISGIKIHISPTETVELDGCTVGGGGLVVLIDITGKRSGIAAGLPPHQPEVLVTPTVADQSVSVTWDEGSFASSPRVQVIDSYGRILSKDTGETSALVLDTFGLPSGMYYLRVFDSATCTHTSFMVQHK